MCVSVCVCVLSIQDQADGSGKRRLDNGEVGRWKLTDDPPPKKKAPPPSSTSEEGGRTDGGHKRKKEKEQPQDSGPKKKVGRTRHVGISSFSSKSVWVFFSVSIVSCFLCGFLL